MATNEQTEQQEEEGGQNISTMDMNITKHKKKRDQNNKRNKKKSGIRFGDLDFKVEQLEFMEQVDTASWQEVVHACCFHDGQEWLGIAGGILLLAACLYFFLFGLGLLGNAAQVLAGCKAGELFGDDNSNPLSSLMTGILATVMMQSSSTTTAIIVSLLEVKALNIQHGIYLVMGANIGTTVTSTIVSIAHMRAFAAATVHDMFNMMTVAVLFPLECATGYLQALTGALTDGAETSRSEPWEGPLKKFVSPLVNKLIVSNKKVMEGVALGGHCSDFYPIQCDPGAAPSYDTCKTGLIACDKTTNE
jgi:sodium-dependent phosphate cotransporter